MAIDDEIEGRTVVAYYDVALFGVESLTALYSQPNANQRQEKWGEDVVKVVDVVP